MKLGLLERLLLNGPNSIEIQVETRLYFSKKRVDTFNSGDKLLSLTVVHDPKKSTETLHFHTYFYFSPVKINDFDRELLDVVVKLQYDMGKLRDHIGNFHISF